MIRGLLRAPTNRANKQKTYETKLQLLQKAKTNFNLVANDYNSDENSDNETKTKTEKPLFASLSSTVSIDPSSVKIYSLKTDLPGNATVKTNDAEEIEPNVVDKPTTTKSKANTFATFESIITGGRNSPSEQDNELIELMKLEVTEVEPQTNAPVLADKPPEIDAKSFKRKRRIEFMTRPIVPVKSSVEVTGTSSNDATRFVTTPEPDTTNTDTTKASDESTAKPIYSNFVRANVEFLGVANQVNNDKLSEGVGVANDEMNKHKSEIGDLRTIIEAKLKFLCNGRPDVSAVQAIFIQFEVSSFVIS